MSIILDKISWHLKRKNRGSFFYQEPIMRYYMIFMYVLAQYAPLDILDQHTFLKSFSDFMSMAFRPVNSCVAESKFPQVSRLVLSFSWLFSPMIGFFIIKEYIKNESNDSMRLKNIKWGKKDQIKAFCCIIIFALGCIWVPFFNTCLEYSIAPINSSRFALGMVGWFLGGGFIGGLLAGIAIFLKKLVDSGFFKLEK